jgi:hypothetical protein
VNTRTLTVARVSRLSLVLAAATAMALSMSYLVGPVEATQPDPLHKVTICHKTHSETNPYVQITVDEASVDGDNGNDHGKGDHLMEHTGPVWYPGAKADGVTWGDIIPPFYSDGTTPTGYPSLNWDATGRSIFNNGCNGADEQPVAEEDTQPESDPEAESVPESGDQGVEAGTGTSEGTMPDGAQSIGGSSPLPTIAFILMLLASLGALAFANVKSVRDIR